MLTQSVITVSEGQKRQNGPQVTDNLGFVLVLEIVPNAHVCTLPLSYTTIPQGFHKVLLEHSYSLLSGTLLQHSRVL